MTDFVLSAFADEASPALEGQIAALRRNGLRQLEIRNIDGRCIVDLEDAELAAVGKELRENGIAVSAIGSPIGKIRVDEPFAPHFERFRRTVHAAQVLGTQRIRMFSFFLPRGEDPESYRDEVLKRLEQLCSYAGKEGVYCCHENEKEIYGDQSRRLHILYETMGGRLKGVYDPANHIQCGERPAEEFPGLLPYTDYLHIKDALLEDGSVVPAGEGDGDIPRLLDLFHSKGAGRLLTIEPHLYDFSGLARLQDEKLLHRRVFSTPDEAFDCAVQALFKILKERGYTYE